MVKKEITITTKTGLGAKPAALFIQKASNYKSSIWIEKGERKANAKSLLGLLALGVDCGSKIVLIAEGDDEKEAVEELGEHLSLKLEESV
ncbi:MAG TPA: HPr family phosphocarrier protein [Acetivibrio sp.]|jgi:phosphocarrier protein|nr:HPr family phosphocarrier protein [Clostridium sp.]HOQ37246.1 HPr family phosphocarrier protein [Acetivibrio sp.]HPT90894.1 HPr family phosphocarrier protein [Acetivibrio sp.]HQA57890.1 HPr family phosphocarrier protein [Acetivibrio sp.]